MSVKISSREISSIGARSGSFTATTLQLARGVKGETGKQGAQGREGKRGPPGKCCDRTHDSLPPMRVIRNGGRRTIYEDDSEILIDSPESVELTPPELKTTILSTGANQDNSSQGKKEDDFYSHITKFLLFISEREVKHYAVIKDQEGNAIHYPLKPRHKYTLLLVENRWIFYSG
jgi:hypothetical protein